MENSSAMVLIVDDDYLVRALLALLVKGIGLTSIEVAGGREALGILKKREMRPGLIICEWSMPEMDGLELLRAYKQDGALRDIPFIMIDGQGGLEVRMLEASEAGADAYLKKPFFPEELEATVTRITGLRPIDSPFLIEGKHFS